MAPVGSLIPVESFRGRSISDIEGNLLGYGETLVVDFAQGKVVVAVISIQDRLIGVPWALVQTRNVLETDDDAHAFVVQARASRLKDAPDFERSVALANPNWTQWSLSTSTFAFCAERAEKLSYTALPRASWGMITSSLSFRPVAITALPN